MMDVDKFSCTVRICQVLDADDVGYEAVDAEDVGDDSFLSLEPYTPETVSY